MARRLVAHLDNCVSGLNQITPPSNSLGFPAHSNPLVQAPLTSSNIGNYYKKYAKKYKN